MRDLPATVALLNDLQELLKDEGLKQLLGTDALISMLYSGLDVGLTRDLVNCPSYCFSDKNFTLREIITDPTELKMYLSDSLRLFSPQVVDTLLDSSVNISQVSWETLMIESKVC